MKDTFDRFQPPERGRFGDNEQASPTGAARSDLIDRDLVLHKETKEGMPNQGAILVSEDASPDHAVWLPKSQVEFVATGGVRHQHNNASGRPLPAVKVTLPRWLATSKGLLA